jgi:EamA domain-containing membrane protein RarD
MALVALSALFWSFGGAIARFMEAGDVWTVVFWRSFWASAFLVAFMVWRDGVSGTLNMVRRMGLPGIVVGLCFATASTTFIVALQYTTVANIVLLQAGVPLLAALMGWALFGERVSGGTWAAIAAVVAGVVIMVSDSFSGAVSPIGDGLAMLIAVAFATATVITRRYSHVRMTPATCLGTIIACLFAATQASTLATSGCSSRLRRRKDRTVNVYNWSDYIDESIIEDFTKETGIKVVYDVFDSNEILETKLLAGGSGYDVVVPSARSCAPDPGRRVPEARQVEAAEHLQHVGCHLRTHCRLRSGQRILGQLHVGHHRHRLQRQEGQGSARHRAVDSWDVVFKPENIAEAEGLRRHIPRPRPTSCRPRSLSRARPELDQAGGSRQGRRDPDGDPPLCPQVPFVGIHQRAGQRRHLPGVGWSGDVFQARDRAAEADQGVEIAYVVPKEGAEMWFDQMAIPADAKHVAEALEFINYMMKPEVAAKASNYVYYANGNKASQQFIDKEISTIRRSTRTRRRWPSCSRSCRYDSEDRSAS